MKDVLSAAEAFAKALEREGGPRWQRALGCAVGVLQTLHEAGRITGAHVCPCTVPTEDFLAALALIINAIEAQIRDPRGAQVSIVSLN